MAGQRRTAPNALAGHRAPRSGLVSIPGGKAGEPKAGAQDVPELPSPASGVRWLAETTRLWEGIWGSDMAEVWRANLGLYLPALYQWLRLQDQLIRAHRAVQKTPLVKGSKDQPRRNPAFDMIPRLEDRIERLNNQLGMTPLALVRMGRPVGGQKTARTPDEASAELENADAAWDWAAE